MAAAAAAHSASRQIAGTMSVATSSLAVVMGVLLLNDFVVTGEAVSVEATVARGSCG